MKVVLVLAVFALFCSLCTAELETGQAEEKPAEHEQAADNREDIKAIFNDKTVPEDEDEDKQEDTTDDDDDDDEAADDETETDETNIKEIASQLKNNKVAKSQGLSLTVGKRGQIVITIGKKRRGCWTTYIHWGKRSCRRGATTLYSGRVAGSHYNHYGDSADYQCMHPRPQFLSRVTVRYPAYLWGTEYETANQVFPYTTQNYNVPCALCKIPKQHQIMIPGRVSCPRGFWREYYGYLMTSYHGHRRSGSHLCVNARPDRIAGSQSNTDGSLLYFVRFYCQNGGGLPCATFLNRFAVTCVVCSKPC